MQDDRTRAISWKVICSNGETTNLTPCCLSTCWQSSPEEVLIRVFSQNFLIESLLRCSLVCSKWARLTKHASCLLFDCIDASSQSEMETAIASMTMRSFGLTRLMIAHEEPYHISESLMLALMIHHGSTLQHLTLSEREGEHCEDTHVSQKLIHLNRHCRALRHLVLDGEFHLKLPLKMNCLAQIVNLELKDVCFFEDSNFASVVNQMTSLRHLALEYLLGVQNLEIIHPRLQTFSACCLTGCDMISLDCDSIEDVAIQEQDHPDTSRMLNTVTISGHCFKLTSLNLRLSGSVELQLASMPALTHLIAHGISWRHLGPLITGCGQLLVAEIGVYGVWNSEPHFEDETFSWGALERFVAATPLLTDLSIGSAIGNRLSTLKMAPDSELNKSSLWPCIQDMRVACVTDHETLIAVLQSLLQVAPNTKMLCVGCMRNMLTTADSADYMRMNAELKLFNSLLELQRHFPRTKCFLE